MDNRPSDRSGEVTALLSENHSSVVQGLSGLYRRSTTVDITTMATQAFSAMPMQEYLRLDIDGEHSLMQASGRFIMNLLSGLHWIARLHKTSKDDLWAGHIWYCQGPEAIQHYTGLYIKLLPCAKTQERRLLTIFFGGGMPARTVEYTFVTAEFYTLAIDQQYIGPQLQTDSLTTIDPCQHLLHADTLDCRQRSLKGVFASAGISIHNSDVVQTLLTTTNISGNTASGWSEAELQDAVHRYWVTQSTQAKPSLFNLFVDQHVIGREVAGLVLHSSEKRQHDGCVTFLQSFAPSSANASAEAHAGSDRLRFTTLVAQIGLACGLEASRKNHFPVPADVYTGAADKPGYLDSLCLDAQQLNSFYRQFDYHFSETELLFLRHIPCSYHEAGYINWNSDYHFEHLQSLQSANLRLQIGVNRAQSLFEFLEIINLEVRLTNNGNSAVSLAKQILRQHENMLVVIKKDGMASRQWLPYVHYLYHTETINLQPGQSLYETLMISAGRNGWDIAEPGNYTVRIGLRLADQFIVSNALRLRISAARVHDEEVCAQDILNRQVGQVIAAGGSRYHVGVNDVLQETTIRLPNKQIARYAKVTLALPMLTSFKSVHIENDNNRTSLSVEMGQADTVVAHDYLESVLIDEAEYSVQSLGHIQYKRLLNALCTCVAENNPLLAEKYRQLGYKTLAKRNVPDALAK